MPTMGVWRKLQICTEGESTLQKLIENACDACVERAESGPAHDVKARRAGLEKTGSEHIPGDSSTDYTYWVCPECGQEWTEIVDSGKGGHGRFLHIGR